LRCRLLEGCRTFPDRAVRTVGPLVAIKRARDGVQSFLSTRTDTDMYKKAQGAWIRGAATNDICCCWTSVTQRSQAWADASGSRQRAPPAPRVEKRRPGGGRLAAEGCFWDGPVPAAPSCRVRACHTVRFLLANRTGPEAAVCWRAAASRVVRVTRFKVRCALSERSGDGDKR
jgi:hypothetical protein